MKKLFFTAAILFLMAIMYAVNANPVHRINTEQTVVNARPWFKHIGTNDLPQPIRNAVSNEFKDATVIEAYVAYLQDGSKLYKVILSVEGQEESIMYDANGSRYQMN